MLREWMTVVRVQRVPWGFHLRARVLGTSGYPFAIQLGPVEVIVGYWESAQARFAQNPLPTRPPLPPPPPPPDV